MVIFLVLVLFLELWLSFLSFVSSIFSHIFSDTRTSQSGTGRFSTFFTYQGQVCMVFRYKINNVGILGRFIVFYLCFSYRLWTLTYLSLCFIHFDIIFLIMSSKLDLWIGLMARIQILQQTWVCILMTPTIYSKYLPWNDS